MQVLTDAGAEDLYKVRPEAAVTSEDPADGPVRFAADKNRVIKPSKQQSEQALPEEIEEAEQDAADPTHEKEIPPK